MKIITSIVVAILVTVAISVSLQASPNHQTYSECSIEDKDFGNPVESGGDALVTPLQNLRITCDVSDNARNASWNVSTELLNPKWSVTDTAGRHPPVFEQTINLKDYSDRLEIELTGNVAWPRVLGRFGGEEASYTAETAPGVRTRIVSFAGQSGGPPVHYEVIAAHPDHIEALRVIEALDNRDPSVDAYVQPIRQAANAAVEEGRPWRAIELIETMTPVLDIATEDRHEYEELDRRSQGFFTSQFAWGFGIMFAITLVGVVLTFLVATIRNRPSNRKSGDDSPEPPRDVQEETETSTGGGGIVR